MPVRAPAVKPSQQMHQALVNLNLAAAKLLSRFLPMQAAAAGEEEEGWRARLLDYYTGIMDAGLLLPSRYASQKICGLCHTVCYVILPSGSLVKEYHIVSSPRRSCHIH